MAIDHDHEHPKSSAASAIGGAATIIVAILAAGAMAMMRFEQGNAETSAHGPAAPLGTQQRERYWETIPSAAHKFEMLPVSGDAAHKIAPFWISKTEITWDAFDVYVYGLDESASTQAVAGTGAQTRPDAVTRPTKPYLPPDRGFGHEGFAAIGMSHHHAREFCRWLSAKPGRRYRLPTEDEWEHACGAGSTAAYSFGNDASKLGDYAWFAGNSEQVPHEVGKKKPNAWGLRDMHGNVAEWVDGRDGKPVLKGGSYRDAADKLKIAARVPYDPAWNASDPQIPKSIWWLADAPFVGFRVVCDGPAQPAATQSAATQTQGKNTED